MAVEVVPSRLLPRDVLRVATAGLATRRSRAVLSAMGIAIAIASMVAVLGISESSKADLVAKLDRLGTNLLTAKPGQTLFGDAAKLPKAAEEMASRIRGVEQVSKVGSVDATVRRTDYIDPIETGGLTVMATDSNLVGTVGGRLSAGRFLDAATARYPAVVLGATAAERLGLTRLAGNPQVWIEGRWWSVIGILEPLELASDLDTAVLVGFPAAAKYLDDDGYASALYLRADPDVVDDVADVLARTVNPEKPEEVEVSRPSDALAARAAAKGALTALFLGLGAVALVVGGLGIANVMVISVLERRSEIGLRRALGATKRHIAAQFLTESVLLAAIGGVAGVGAGVVIIAAYASTRGWDIAIPPVVLFGGLGAALAIGAVAGLYPASRAARMAPTDALRAV
ncbi:MAG: ABC transporter permease [Actinomycetota bacterium]|nr:ABC transporter permease [Actinomycetota bacterium]